MQFTIFKTESEMEDIQRIWLYAISNSIESNWIQLIWQQSLITITLLNTKLK